MEGEGETMGDSYGLSTIQATNTEYNCATIARVNTGPNPTPDPNTTNGLLNNFRFQNIAETSAQTTAATTAHVSNFPLYEYCPSFRRLFPFSFLFLVREKVNSPCGRGEGKEEKRTLCQRNPG